MANIPRSLIRLSAFLRKEIFTITRQPLLVLTLVLGPFLILFFFGIGYRNEARALRTMFVVEEDDALAQKIEQYAANLGPQLIFAGITHDLAEAEDKLRRGEIDLITVVPANAYETVRNNQQVTLRLLHQEIDPLQADYINVFGRVYVDEINRRILRFITTEGQVNVSQAQDELDAALASAKSLRKLLEECATTLTQVVENGQCNSDAVRKYVRDLDHNLDDVNQALGNNVRLNEIVQNQLSDQNEVDPQEGIDARLTKIIQDTNELDELGDEADSYIKQLETLTKLETDLVTIEDKLAEFLDIEPRVLISPFRSQAESIAPVILGPADFFAPSVIVLLLQHLAITFAALSVVRERQLGSMELFYVAPLTAIETLLGKYLSYLIFGGVLAAILLTLVVFGMGVPMLGWWLYVGIIVVALLFTSLGIGFVISLISKSDIEAVQYSMIVLLTSVFFSSFILGLETLWRPVRIISWAVPATYGNIMLRDVMLRGAPLALPMLGQLVLIGAGLFILSWFLLRRSMAHSN